MADISLARLEQWTSTDSAGVLYRLAKYILHNCRYKEFEAFPGSNQGLKRYHFPVEFELSVFPALTNENETSRSDRSSQK